MKSVKKDIFRGALFCNHTNAAQLLGFFVISGHTKLIVKDRYYH